MGDDHYHDRGFSNKEFKKKEYWDKRFEEEEDFDWFHPYRAFRHHIRDRVTSITAQMMSYLPKLTIIFFWVRRFARVTGS